MRAGGNAVDGAIACALVAGVVDPMMTGIAGFGSGQFYLPGKNVHECIDFHGKTPGAARPDMWARPLEGETRDGFGFVLKGRVNDLGYQSITVPGSLRAFHEAQTAHGALPWAQVVQPAIDWAERGWLVKPHVGYWWAIEEQMGRVANPERLRFSPSGRALYCRPDGSPKRVGDTVRNPDLAATLRLDRQGRRRRLLHGRARRAHRRGHAAPRRAPVLRGPRELSDHAPAASAGHLPRLAARHQSSARRRADAPRDAQRPRAVRSPRARPQHRPLHPRRRGGHEARRRRQGGACRRPRVRAGAGRAPALQGAREERPPTTSARGGACASIGWGCPSRRTPPTWP